MPAPATCSRLNSAPTRTSDTPRFTATITAATRTARPSARPCGHITVLKCCTNRKARGCRPTRTKTLSCTGSWPGKLDHFSHRGLCRAVPPDTNFQATLKIFPGPPKSRRKATQRGGASHPAPHATSRRVVLQPETKHQEHFYGCYQHQHHR